MSQSVCSEFRLLTALLRKIKRDVVRAIESNGAAAQVNTIAHGLKKQGENALLRLRLLLRLNHDHRNDNSRHIHE